jgi:hypothetical protein
LKVTEFVILAMSEDRTVTVAGDSLSFVAGYATVKIEASGLDIV